MTVVHTNHNTANIPVSAVSHPLPLITGASITGPILITEHSTITIAITVAIATTITMYFKAITVPLAPPTSLDITHRDSA